MSEITWDDFIKEYKKSVEIPKGYLSPRDVCYKLGIKYNPNIHRVLDRYVSQNKLLKIKIKHSCYYKPK